MESKKIHDDRRILFAVPKKGRLYEHVLKVLEGAGLSYHRSNRLDLAQCTTLPVTLVFLPASDIATYVAQGEVDLGITGQDIIAESGVDLKVIMELGFGKCRLCVQAPIGKYKDPKEIAGLRVVTSFPKVTQRFFERYPNGDKTQIRYVSGSVEAACALGLADAIVDLVETGTTMQAAGLEVVSEILSSNAVLVAKPDAPEQIKSIITKIHQRIEGYLISTRYVMCTYNVERKNLPAAKQITPGMESPTVTSLDDPDWVAVSALVEAGNANRIMDRLQDAGARSILIFKLDNARFPT